MTEVDERRVEIEKLHDGFRLGAHSFGFWDPHHQGNPRSDIEDGHLVPPSVFAKMVAMVSQENDHRIVPQLQTIHRIEQFSHLGIHESGTRMIGPFELTTILVRKGLEVVSVR